jgi:hypothetical protein
VFRVDKNIMPHFPDELFLAVGRHCNIDARLNLAKALGWSAFEFIGRVKDPDDELGKHILAKKRWWKQGSAMVVFNRKGLRIWQNCGNSGSDILVFHYFPTDVMVYRMKCGIWSMGYDGDPPLLSFGYINQSSACLKESLRLTESIH